MSTYNIPCNCTLSRTLPHFIVLTVQVFIINLTLCYALTTEDDRRSVMAHKINQVVLFDFSEQIQMEKNLSKAYLVNRKFVRIVIIILKAGEKEQLYQIDKPP